MNWRKLAAIGAGALIVLFVLRRTRRVDPVESEIAISSERNDASESASSGTDLETLDGIGAAYAERLRGVGIHTVADLVDADPDRLAAETDIGEARIRSWIDQASTDAED